MDSLISTIIEQSTKFIRNFHDRLEFYEAVIEELVGLDYSDFEKHLGEDNVFDQAMRNIEVIDNELETEYDENGYDD
jgi:hypothetical protein